MVVLHNEIHACPTTVGLPVLYLSSDHFSFLHITIIIISISIVVIINDLAHKWPNYFGLTSKKTLLS